MTTRRDFLKMGFGALGAGTLISEASFSGGRFLLGGVGNIWVYHDRPILMNPGTRTFHPQFGGQRASQVITMSGWDPNYRKTLEGRHCALISLRGRPVGKQDKPWRPHLQGLSYYKHSEVLGEDALVTHYLNLARFRDEIQEDLQTILREARTSMPSFGVGEAVLLVQVSSLSEDFRAASGGRAGWSTMSAEVAFALAEPEDVATHPDSVNGEIPLPGQQRESLSNLILTEQTALSYWDRGHRGSARNILQQAFRQVRRTS
jgi:hypothetical protein